jgi:hypothetical protein
MKTKKCKQCHRVFGLQSERINYSPYGLFCDNQCIKDFEESDECPITSGKAYNQQSKTFIK